MKNTLNPPQKTFLTDDFLLKSDFAKTLYHDHAKKMPIIDYHCHLSPHDIAKNRQFTNMTEVWLKGDHYKWRAMRTLGVNEKYITGQSTDAEKFQKWAESVPYTMRNPLFHWTHLELDRYFGIDELLTGNSGPEIYERTTELLQQKSYSTQGLLSKMNVEVVCSTDDPTDDLAYHQQAKKDGLKILLLPAFRPDKAYAVEDPNSYSTYLDKLSTVSRTRIHNYDDLISALENRVAYFHENGGRLSDHGLEQIYFFEKGKYSISSLFDKVKKGDKLVELE
ncbi:MAG: glucuronate isomerase, partial [Cyclobacteriaceae bacterium]